MRTLTLGFPWVGGVRLSAKAVVIGPVALTFGTAHVTQAGINVWSSHGPYGGYVFALAIDPSTPSTLYAGTYGGGVFQSTNSGGSWSAVNTGLSGNAPTVFALAVDPSTPSTLYAGTEGGGVFQSTNSGGSWSAVNTDLSGDALNVNALAINPTTPSTLYAGTDDGVFSIQQVSVCVGDCNDDGTVTVDEILTMVNIALGNAPVTTCEAGDANHDGQITVDEILTAVNDTLNGCGGS